VRPYLKTIAPSAETHGFVCVCTFPYTSPFQLLLVHAIHISCIAIWHIASKVKFKVSIFSIYLANLVIEMNSTKMLMEVGQEVHRRTVTALLLE
jgi:hypothetical protein